MGLSLYPALLGVSCRPKPATSSSFTFGVAGRMDGNVPTTTTIGVFELSLGAFGHYSSSALTLDGKKS